MALITAAFLAVSCYKKQKIPTKEGEISAPQPEAMVDRKIHVEVQDGLVTVTERQSRLVSGVTDLSVGMSQHDVKERLGNPTEESPELLFYNCVESRHEGGHFVTARLVFCDEGLTSAKVGYGHVTLEPRTEQ